MASAGSLCPEAAMIFHLAGAGPKVLELMGPEFPTLSITRAEIFPESKGKGFWNLRDSFVGSEPSTV